MTLRRDPEALLFRHHAMATWFELHLPDVEPKFAKGVAVEAFLLLDRLEGLLSRYREDSEISIISRLQPGERYRVTGEVFDCLAAALSFSETTRGAFDPALGSEMDQRRGLNPPEEIRPRGRLLLDREQSLICSEEGTVPLDLGGIGKGYALDCLAKMLKEWGVHEALLSGGGSSLKTLAEPNDSEAPCWSVSMGDGSRLWLQSGAVGCSGIAVQGAHILDPRTGLPAEGPDRVWVLAPEAAEADAFSTAFMILSREEILEIAGERESLAVAQQQKLEGPVEWLVPPVAGIHGAVMGSFNF